MVFLAQRKRGKLGRSGGSGGDRYSDRAWLNHSTWLGGVYFDLGIGYEKTRPKDGRALFDA